MGFITTGKLLGLLTALAFGGGISAIGVFAYDNHHLKNRIHELESELLSKYVQITTLNQELLKQADEMNKANNSLERYKIKVQKKYSVLPGSNPCDSNILDNLLKKWNDKDV